MSRHELNLRKSPPRSHMKGELERQKRRHQRFKHTASIKARNRKGINLVSLKKVFTFI